MTDLAIIVGGGALPRLLQDAEPLAKIVVMRGVATEFAPAAPITGEFERLPKLFENLRAAGIKQLCFAGAMTRPKLRISKLDLRTWRKLPAIMRAMKSGDAALLAFVRAWVEAEGFEVVGAQQLRPDLLSGNTPLNVPPPPPLDLEAARLAHQEMSAQDQGQALVFRDGKIIACEGRAGTKAMIAANPAKGAVLFKASKRGQDLDMDMASIGAQTVYECAEAGYAGIVIERGRVLLIDREKIEAAANETGLFIAEVDAP